jgi:hypothetical protein
MVKHLRDFKIALDIMTELKRSGGTIEPQDFGHRQFSLDQNFLQMWLYTLLGCGYIKRINPHLNRNCYSLTCKGEDEDQYHPSIERHKIFIQSMTY